VEGIELFKPVNAKVNYPELEAQVGRHWEEHDVFRRSLEQRADAPLFRFYEGPPTANGKPHVGHMLARALKDLIPRYQTMRGKRVPRKAGWDTHGLPVELEVEKELGISGKPEIEAYGIERFNQKCRESVWRYQSDWEGSTRRLGYWLDLDNPYITYTNDYIESVWWALRQLWDKGLLYKGRKIVPYCPRCGTSLSSHEVAQGYASAEDPSVYVRFELTELLGETVTVPTALLVWTTTPWTLPSNVAVAVNPAEPYVLVELTVGDNVERLVLARGCLQSVLGDVGGNLYRVVAEFPGERLVGLKYKPPLDFVPEPAPGSGEQAFVVLPAEFVSLDEGTGMVHIAPAFGEDDFMMGRLHKLPLFQPIDTAGKFTSEVPDWQGVFVKDADPAITEELKSRGVLFRAGTYEHTYPFCWRCDAPLIYYARESWFIRTTAHQDRLIEINRGINWLPGHLREGRFGNFLDSLVDWNLSRERYWGSPLPIWFCENCEHGHCIGSYSELREMAASPLAEPFDPHKPYIDDVALRCPSCGEGTMRRVPYVIDCWFESGSMPFAQYHYPFENKEQFESMFPADYICEAIDQTRGWFYSLHAIASLIFERPAYLNCLCTEFVVDGEGHKMSKHRGNVISPDDVFKVQGADALRWFLFAGSPPWTVKRVDKAAVTDAQNQVLDTLWNVYSFFVLYANIDGFDPRAARTAKAPDPASRPVLDRWMLSRLHGTLGEVRGKLDAYDAMGAARVIADLIDDLSNWYVRRGRKRYWKAEDDADKLAAHWTLYETLVALTQMMAPFVPFVSDSIYTNLAGAGDGDSVHLTDYPEVDAALRDPRLETEMAFCRRLVGLGRACRNRAAIRTRQPLPEVVVSGARLRPEVEALLADELNVKAVRYDEEPESYVDYELKLNYPVAGPVFGKRVPQVAKALAAYDARKGAALHAAGKPLMLTLTLTLAPEGPEGVPGEGGSEETVELAPAYVLVRAQEREGFAVEREGGLQVALSTRVSDDLLLEGLAREVVNRVQRLRKEAGYNVSDRITAMLGAEGDLRRAAERHTEHIAREILATSLEVVATADLAETGKGAGGVQGVESENGIYRQRLEVDGDPLTVVLRRLG
jgi:isoleucyl-tRNA synthetase